MLLPNVIRANSAIAAAHFFWRMRCAKQFDTDPAPFKHCAAHFDRMGARPSVQKLLAFEKPVLDEFASAAQGHNTRSHTPSSAMTPFQVIIADFGTHNNKADQDDGAVVTSFLSLASATASFS